MSTPFSLAILAIVTLSLLGLPIGHAMIAGSILYLLVAGQDLSIAAEQLLNGMYTNYVILAVPLFILAAELMNIGSMTERLLRFCDALVGRFRGGLAQVNVLQSLIFAPRNATIPCGVRRGCSILISISSASCFFAAAVVSSRRSPLSPPAPSPPAPPRRGSSKTTVDTG